MSHSANHEHKTRPGKIAFAQDHGKGHRQHAGAAAMAELIGTPLFGEVMQEMAVLTRYDVRPTPEMVAKAVEIVKRRHEPRSVPAPETHPSPSRLKPRGRFHAIPDVGPVVYYMRIGDRVKIGMTTNLRGRLEAINPEELLALEKGGRAVERRRHQEFAELRTHGEWFRLEGALLVHIESLRAEE